MKHYLKKSLAALLAATMLITPASALTADETLQLLDENYLGKVPDHLRTLTTTEDILTALGDPYTVYLPPKDLEGFLGQVDGGNVVGVGVQIQFSEIGGIEIVSVLPNSPAEENGLVAGDCIIAIDGIVPNSNDHAKSLISGEEDTPVYLTIRHTNGQLTTTCFTRRTVPIPIVTYTDINGVPTMNCLSFGASTADRVRQFLMENGDWNAPYVMDLRQNPGGTDSAVAGCVGAFTGGNIVSYYLNNKDALNYVFTLSATIDYTDNPLIILTSERSASGSEMFSGAMRDHDAAIAIGSRTYGKGVGQRIFSATTHPEFFDGDSMKITTTRFYSPDGATNDTVGIFPTLTIAPEYVEDVAYLLAAPIPEDLTTCLKLDIGEIALYIDINTATSAQYRDAFAELLSAIPSTMLLSIRHGDYWIPMGAPIVSQQLGVPYESRFYSDTANSIYCNQLDELAVHDVLPTSEGNTLNPTETLTRGDFAMLLAYALKLHIVDNNPFNDVPSTDPNAQAIAALCAKGIIEGDSLGNFYPDRLITNQEANMILSTTAQWLCLEAKLTKTNGISPDAIARFSDYAPWARENIAILDSFDGLLPGLIPTETIQRDQAGAMIHQLLSAAGLLWN